MKKGICIRPIVLATLLYPAAALADSVELRGQCEYAERIAKQADGANGLALCNSVLIERNDARGTSDFRHGNSASVIQYEGERSGDTLTIQSVKVDGKISRKAQGKCTIYRDGDNTISTVSCVARIKQLTYAANFVRR